MSEQFPEKRPYCKPLNAGLQSETGAVCRRLARMLQGLDEEISMGIVEGAILDDIRAFRLSTMDRLEKEGWTWSYCGSDRLRFRQPGHKKPYFTVIDGPGGSQRVWRKD